MTFKNIICRIKTNVLAIEMKFGCNIRVLLPNGTVKGFYKIHDPSRVTHQKQLLLSPLTQVGCKKFVKWP